MCGVFVISLLQTRTYSVRWNVEQLDLGVSGTWWVWTNLTGMQVICLHFIPPERKGMFCLTTCPNICLIGGRYILYVSNVLSEI